MSEQILHIDADRYEEVVLRSDRPVVLDFYSTECPPCEALAAKFEALETVYGRDVKFVKMYRQGNRELAQALGVTSSPTLLFYRDGAVTGDRLSGGVKRADVERNLRALLSADRLAAIDAVARPRETTDCDVLIVGAGPAGLTAGIYTAQARFRTIIVDRAMPGGNLAITHQVSNFPGFIEPQPGWQLAHAMAEQAKVAGAEFRSAVDLTRVDLARREVEIDGVETIRAKKVIVATGSSPRPLGVAGEVENRGRGISYCATCDAKYYQDRHVVVIGGGNSAIEESLFIAKFASKITIVHQFDALQANKVAQEAAFANPKISFRFSTEPREFVRTGATVGRVVVEDLKTRERYPIECDGVFVFAGMRPNLEPFEGAFELDAWGYVKVAEDMRTSVPDVYAAGDVRTKQFRQMTTAVSDGTIAAMAIARELGG
jgi:thioredoxin reductase (NADPH)